MLLIHVVVIVPDVAVVVVLLARLAAVILGAEQTRGRLRGVSGGGFRGFVCWSLFGGREPVEGRGISSGILWSGGLWSDGYMLLRRWVKLSRFITIFATPLKRYFRLSY